MKLLKLCSALALVVSLNASEIKPFGKFKFGDSITPTIEKICSLKSINKVGLIDEQSMENVTYFDKTEFCSKGKKGLEQFETTQRVKSFKLKGSSQYIGYFVSGFTFILDGVNIKGVPFKILIEMQQDRRLEGQYLMIKNDTLNIKKKVKVGEENDEYFTPIYGNVNLHIPLMVHEIMLKTKDEQLLKVNRSKIYNLLKNKYSNMDIVTNERAMQLRVKGDNNTILTFDYQLKYEKDMSSLFNRNYNKYLKQLSANTPDNSNDL